MLSHPEECRHPPSIHHRVFLPGEQRATPSGDSQDALVLCGMWSEEAVKPLGPFVAEGV